ncbi:MAG: hypothetical protein QGH20_10340 [Candidatus Latescibacteria bacterium]|nr:hypothetical protein [Candidatus Latescibacterota bacterium]
MAIGEEFGFGRDDTQIFAAFNISCLLSAYITLADGGIEMSNEDYQTLIKSFLIQVGPINKLSLTPKSVGEKSWLEWTVSQAGSTTSYAFFQRGTQNYIIFVITPDDAFPRRKKEIASIMTSFRFLK